MTVLTVCSVAVLGACRVDASVDLAVDTAGAGRVVVDVALDRDAVAEIGDLTTQLRIADLQASGWEIEGPVDAGDGGQRVRATKRFATVTQGEAVLAEVGPPVGGLRLARGRSFLRTTTEITGALDLTAGLDAFGDSELTGQLGGLPFGIEAAEIERRLGAPPAQAVGFAVTVRLPDDGRAPPARWTPQLGERLDVEATGQRLNRLNIVFAVVAFLFAAAFVASWRRPQPAGRHDEARDPGGGDEAE